jgi:translation elongation factor EF-G
VSAPSRNIYKDSVQELNKMDVLISQLVLTAQQLVEIYGVDHKKIKKEIYDGLRVLSEKLPKKQVLYNCVHGGYDYAKQFSDFIEEDIEYYGYSKATRVAHVEKVKAFGNACKEKYPLVIKLIAIHNKYHLKQVFYYAWKLKDAHKALSRFASIYDTVLNTTEDFFGTVENVEYISYIPDFKVENVSKYSKQALIQYIAKITNEKKDEIQNSYSKMKQLVTDDICNLVLENYDTVFDEERLDTNCKWYEKKNWTERMVENQGSVKLTFIDAIDYYGESHFAIWKCQEHYNDKVMRFLLKHHEKFAVECSRSCTNLEVGLLFASGAYCKLSIGEAPQILSWKIKEYDGLESIVVEP